METFIELKSVEKNMTNSEVYFENSQENGIEFSSVYDVSIQKIAPVHISVNITI